MGVLVRGAKNAFRNWLRTGAVVLILAIGIGLGLSMLVANQAVQAKIDTLKQQVGTTLLVNPAGSRGMEGGGEPLKDADAEKAKSVEHVTAVVAINRFTLLTTGQQTPMMVKGGSGETDLEASTDAGTLGRRSFSGTIIPHTDIKLPIRGIGTSGNIDDTGRAYNITSGRELKSEDTNAALVGKQLAEKNNLSLNSTFTAFGESFTVVGVFDQGGEFENNAVVIPIKTAQRVIDLQDEIGVAVVTVDSLDNLEETEAALKTALGADRVDITSTQQNIQTALDSLASVQRVSLIGFVGSLIAAAIIIFLVMIVIVRERKREIGVLKAIGGSNATVVAQFVTEAIVLVAMATVVGLGLTYAASGPIAQALVSSSSSQNEGNVTSAGPGQRMMRLGGNAVKDPQSLVQGVTASVGPSTLAYGLVAMLAIAIIGSAVPAWLIAKIRPAEVMRGE